MVLRSVNFLILLSMMEAGETETLANQRTLMIISRRVFPYEGAHVSARVDHRTSYDRLNPMVLRLFFLNALLHEAACSAISLYVCIYSLYVHSGAGISANIEAAFAHTIPQQ